MPSHATEETLKPDIQPRKNYSSRLFHDMEHQGALGRKRGAFRRTLEISLLLVILDTLLVTALYIDLTWLLKGAGALGYVNPSTLLMMLSAQMMCTTIVGGYSRKSDMASLRYACEHFLGAAAGFLVTILVVYYLAPEYFVASRATVLSTLGLAPFIQLGYRRGLYSHAVRRRGDRALIVIGDAEDDHDVEVLLNRKNTPYTLYYLSPETGRISSASTAVNPLGGSGLDQAVSRLGQRLEAIVIATRADTLPPEMQNRLVAANFKLAPVYTLETFHARELKTVPLNTLSAPWALNEGFRLAQSATYSRLKRLMDLGFAGAAIVLLLPLLIVVAALVKADSPGPAFFKQTRVGQHETPFELYKFRTMRVGSEKGPMYTGDRDPRITRVGGFLRKSRLDELPQLINVLRGDMSVIGPRAEWNRLVVGYEHQIPYYHLRHLVRPGITGWAQVNYPYGANLDDTRNKLRFDLYYVRYFSFMLDLNIMVKTAYIMLFGKGR